jgi:hypothetical protein
MDQKKQITNELIRKKFTSQFDLVNYAISLAENMIRTGRDSRVKIDTQNRAMQVIAEIVTGNDQFDEVAAAPAVQVEEATFKTKSSEFRNMKETGKSRTADAKKARRAFED